MNITTFNESKELIKEGLLFYSSNENNPLIDSNGISHNISSEDIKELANNTNKYLELTDIYVYKDHVRDPEYALGLISGSGCFEAKEITEEMATTYTKLKPLVGRWGLFCNNIKLTNEHIIDKVSKGLSKSVSIGADLVKKIVKELSITGTPAAPGSALFSTQLSNITKFMDTAAVTLEEALQTTDDNEELKSEAIELLCTFLSVVSNISAMSDEDLGNYQVASKEELYQSQLETFMSLLDEKINPFDIPELNQQQLDPRMQPQMQQYSYPLTITTFNEMDEYISEYGFIGNAVKMAGGTLKKKVLGASTALGSKVKPIKTTIANTANKGLNAVGTLGSKLAKTPGNLNKIGTGIMKKSSGLADKINNKRLGKYNNPNKLSNFNK